MPTITSTSIGPNEWKEGHLTTASELWTLAKMKAKHAEGLRGADRKGIRSDHYLLSVLREQMGLSLSLSISRESATYYSAYSRELR
jgi:hypothetical protein